MTRWLVLILAPALIAACTAAQPRLPEAKGPIRPLNAGRWQSLKADLRAPRAPLPPSQSPSLRASEVRR